MDVPTIATPRLILDAHREEDLDAAAAMWSDPAVVRHIGGRAFAREEVWHRLQRYRGHWTMKAYGLWAIRDRADGRFLGEIGFADFKRTLVPPVDLAPEAGWVLASAAHGRGLAAEALGAALAWAEVHLPAPRITAMIDPANAASIRVAERHGFAPLRPVDYHGRASLLFARTLRTNGAVTS